MLLHVADVGAPHLSCLNMRDGVAAHARCYRSTCEMLLLHMSDILAAHVRYSCCTCEIFLLHM